MTLSLRVPASLDELLNYRLLRLYAASGAPVIRLLEGRYGRARQFAEEALAIPQSSGLSALVAARAAIETRDFDVAEKLPVVGGYDNSRLGGVERVGQFVDERDR